jgi:hypothetical protein
MDIGREQSPYVLEPVEDPVPSRVPAPDKQRDPVEAPAVPVEVGA